MGSKEDRSQDTEDCQGVVELAERQVQQQLKTTYFDKHLEAVVVSCLSLTGNGNSRCGAVSWLDYHEEPT